MRYNEETDIVQIFFNNQWNDWKSANLQAYYLFKSGIGLQNDVTAQIADSFGNAISITDSSITVTPNTSNQWAIPSFSLDFSSFIGKGKKLYIDMQASGSSISGDRIAFQPSAFSWKNSSGLDLSFLANERVNIVVDIDTYANSTNKYLAIGINGKTISIYNLYIK